MSYFYEGREKIKLTNPTNNSITKSKNYTFGNNNSTQKEYLNRKINSMLNYSTKNNDNNKKTNDNIQYDSLNSSNNKNNNENFLNYNYDNIDENNYLINNTEGKTKEEIISELIKENNELRNDMKKLYFLTRENKNSLLKHIQLLKDENNKIKAEKNNLEYQLLMEKNKNNELETDNEQLIDDHKVIKDKYLNEIRELNCQLNNYKLKLDKINLEYDQLLSDYHFLKKQQIFQVPTPSPRLRNNIQENEGKVDNDNRLSNH